MPLHLIAREVALANITEFHRLGAFLGEKECKYHYAHSIGCAIGIMDKEEVLLMCNTNADVSFLVRNGIVSTDNEVLLEAIQRIHDYKTFSYESLSHRLGSLSRRDTTIGRQIEDLICNINHPRDLTPERYKEIMARLAELPTQQEELKKIAAEIEKEEEHEEEQFEEREEIGFGLYEPSAV